MQRMVRYQLHDCLVKAIWIDGEKLPFCDEGCKVPVAVGGCSSSLLAPKRPWWTLARHSLQFRLQFFRSCMND